MKKWKGKSRGNRAVRKCALNVSGASLCVLFWWTLWAFGLPASVVYSLPLNRSPVLQCIYHSSQLGVICTPAEGDLHPIVRSITKNFGSSIDMRSMPLITRFCTAQSSFQTLFAASNYQQQSMLNMQNWFYCVLVLMEGSIWTSLQGNQEEPKKINLS